METRLKSWNVHIQSKYMYVILFLEFIYDGSFSFVYVRNILWDLGYMYTICVDISNVQLDQRLN
jgi:hypothetical protein